MHEYRDVCEGRTFPVFSTVVISIFGIIISRKIAELVVRLLRKMKLLKPNPVSSACVKAVSDLKKFTSQIAHDWIEMTELLTALKEDQDSFIKRIQTQFESKNEILCRNINVFLEEEFLRNDQQFSKIKRTLEALLEDIHSMKNSIFKEDNTKNLINRKTDLKYLNLVDNHTQTEFDFKKRSREGHAKSRSVESESSRLVAVVKQCFADLIKDTKLHLSIDREDESKEIQLIFTKLAEDRDDIKKTILQAFSMAAEEAKQNYSQYGRIGQEAMHYMAVLNENTNKILKVKLEETDKRLKEILNALNRQVIDVVAIRETLENIDGQFDDIFRRVELGCQRNTEHCEEMAQCLEKTSKNWIGTASELGEIASAFMEETRKMKESMRALRITGNVGQDSTNDSLQIYQNSGKNLEYEADESGKERLPISKNQNFNFIYSMIETCSDKIETLNKKVESGTVQISSLIEELVQKLQLLRESLRKMEIIIKNSDVENIARRIRCRCEELSSGEDFKFNMQDAGDCKPETFRNLNTTINEISRQKILNTDAIDKAVRMIEIIQKKASGKDYATISQDLNVENDNEEGVFLEEDL